MLSRMLFSVTVPGDNERGPLFAEAVFDAIHRRLRFFQSVSFEIAQIEKQVKLLVRCHDGHVTFVRRELLAAYPDAEIAAVADSNAADTGKQKTKKRWLILSPKGAILRTWTDFFDREQRTLADPVAGLLNLVHDERLDVRIVLSVRPALRNRWKPGTPPDRASGDKANHRNRFSVSLMLSVSAERSEKRRIHSKLRDLEASFGRFTGSDAAFRRAFLSKRFSLTTPELATLWHPPTAEVKIERKGVTGSRTLEPPVNLPGITRGSAILGRTTFRDRNRLCGIPRNDRSRHAYICGKTGVGKTTLLAAQIQADITSNRGVLFLDPHGDAAESIADSVPTHRTNDVIYFDPADSSCPIGLNMLDCPKAEDRPRLASEIVSILQSIYGLDAAHAPRLLDITRNALLALMEVKGTTLLSLVRMLGDRTFRQGIVSKVSDPVVRNYWREEFERWKPSDQAMAVASVQNKLRPFIVDYRLRSILGQETNRLNLRHVMDSGQILIANLSKGRLGDDTSRLLGSLIVSKLQIDALSRADIPETSRRPFYACIDEFQNFATESFATILSEARKYGLSLTVANQFIGQLERDRDIGETLKGAIFGNVGSLVAFQVGPDDAAILTEQFGGTVEPHDLLNLPKYNAYVRMLIDGVPCRPFSIQTLPPDRSHPQNRLPIIRRTTGHRYGRPEKQVKQEIARAMGG